MSEAKNTGIGFTNVCSKIVKIVLHILLSTFIDQKFHLFGSLKNSFF